MEDRGEQTVLVVEDDDMLRELIAHQLRHHGYRVLEAPDGGSGLTVAREQFPHVVLLDVNLPDLPGWDVCARLKSEERTRTIPIVMMTALDSSEDRWRGMESGADDYLTKPFQPQELLIRVRSILRLCQFHRSQAESEQLRVRLETQQEFDRLKESFISILSHELHTPLTVLKGYMGLLKEMRRSPGAARILDESLDDMTASLVQLESLIRELLDYSRLHSGILTLRRRPLDLRQLVGESCAGLEQGARDKGVRFDFDFPRHPVKLRADRDRLAQAIRHLVENAVKFTPGGGWIQVGCRDRGDSVLVRVRDSGEGISQKDLQRIFEPFYQAADHMTRRSGGMGLGLTTARHIVSDHGGEIRASSRPGEGSEFVIRLPRSHHDAREVLARLRRRMRELESRVPGLGREAATKDSL